MVSLAKWENQALMGYIKKYGRVWTHVSAQEQPE